MCLRRILSYAEGEGWKGYDPYDGLLSPFGRFPLPLYRLLFQQLVKRSPLWVRRLLLIPKTHNPKGLALFLWTYALLGEKGRAEGVFNLLMGYRTEVEGGIAFGYNFDWQSSVFFVPAFTPNTIATSFAVFALSQANTNLGWKFNLTSFLPFYERVLNRFRDGNGRLWMSYTPLDRLRIFNASILGALAYALAGGDRRVLLEVGDTLSYYQGERGEWSYGLGSRRMHYIDHIHTAYNLWGLRWASEFLRTDRWRTTVERGFNFYLENLFNDRGIPINRIGRDSHDTHDVAAAIITLKMFGREDWANRLEEYACRELVAPSGAVFNGPKDRRVFMRWSVAWLSLALSFPTGT